MSRFNAPWRKHRPSVVDPLSDFLSVVEQLKKNTDSELRNAANHPDSRKTIERTAAQMREMLDTWEPAFAQYREQEQRLTAVLESTSGELQA
jgi:hypothetical protein